MTTCPPESECRDSLALVRALITGDDEAAMVISRHADQRELMTDVAARLLFLVTSQVADPLRPIDAMFEKAGATLAAAEHRRRQRDGHGDGAA